MQTISCTTFFFFLKAKQASVTTMQHLHDSLHTRSSMSMIECEDSTLLSLSHDIDRHTSQLRHDVLQSIASIRSKLHQQTAEAIEHQQIISQATEERLIQQIEHLQSLLEVRTSELARERQLTDKLISAQFLQKRRQRQREAALEALRAWHKLVSREKELNLIAEKAVKESQERKARAAFAAWRLQSVKLKYEKILEKTVGDQRRAAAKSTHERQALENASKIEILALKEKVSHEEERRAVLEEKLKAAFMRGVCALNLEAMQVLRNTTEAGMLETSVASLVQQINISGVESHEPSLHLASGENENDTATLTRLLQRQQALSAQMGALQTSALNPAQNAAAPAHTKPAAGATSLLADHHKGQCRTQPSSSSGVSGRVIASSGTAAVHQAFTVSVNPSYSTGNTALVRGGVAPASRIGVAPRPASSATPRGLRK
jgi:hypothetical protein